MCDRNFQGGREGGKEGRREGGRERAGEGGRVAGRVEGRKGGREGGREGGCDGNYGVCAYGMKLVHNRLQSQQRRYSLILFCIGSDINKSSHYVSAEQGSMRISTYVSTWISLHGCGLC